MVRTTGTVVDARHGACGAGAAKDPRVRGATEKLRGVLPSRVWPEVSVNGVPTRVYRNNPYGARVVSERDECAAVKVSPSRVWREVSVNGVPRRVYRNNPYGARVVSERDECVAAEGSQPKRLWSDVTEQQLCVYLAELNAASRVDAQGRCVFVDLRVATLAAHRLPDDAGPEGGRVVAFYAVRVAFHTMTRECRSTARLSVADLVVAETPDGVDMGVVISVRAMDGTEDAGVPAVPTAHVQYPGRRPAPVCKRAVVPKRVPAGWRVLKVLRTAHALDMERRYLQRHYSVSRGVPLAAQLLQQHCDPRLRIVDVVLQLDGRRVYLTLGRPDRSVRADLARLERYARDQFRCRIRFLYADKLGI